MQTMVNKTWRALFRRGEGDAHSSSRDENDIQSSRRILRIKKQMKAIMDGELNLLRAQMRIKNRPYIKANGRADAVCATSRPAPVALAVLSGKIDAIEAAVSHEWRRASVPAPQPCATSAPGEVAEADVEGDVACFGASTQFSASIIFAVDPADPGNLSILDDAASALACGSSSAAQRLLHDAIQPRSNEAMNKQLWLAMLDLLRVTDQPREFESLVLDFCVRFNEEAPFDFSPAPGPGANFGPDPYAAHSAAVTSHFDNSPDGAWRAPAMLGEQDVHDLRHHIENAPAAQPVGLDWRDLVQLSAPAVGALTETLLWAAQRPCHFVHFVPAELMRAISLTEEQGVVAQKAGWILRFALLAWLNKSAIYESFAIRYCVRFEVSPPDWHAPACTSAVVRDSAADLKIADRPIELHGEIVGDSDPQLMLLARRLENPDMYAGHIDCSALVRMDFSACAHLLNCLAARPPHSGRVRLANVHRLMARLFVNVGCGDLAAIRLRE